MNLKEILAISGYSGLYKFVSQGRNGVIVEGLIDNKRLNAPASARVSALEDIAIYTEEKELPLKEVLRRIFQKENGAASIDPKLSTDALKKYFLEVVPDYDQSRVYASDIKKVLTWYGILLGQNIIDMEPDPVEEDKEAEKA